MRPALAIAVLVLTACASCGGSDGGNDPAPPPQATPALAPTKVDHPTPTATPTQVVLAPMRAWSLGYIQGVDASRPVYVVLRSEDGGETWEVIRRSSRR